MRLSHFEVFQPICPLCRRDRHLSIPLRLKAHNQCDDWVEEGVLVCSHCHSQYPILYGIPVLLPDVDSYLSNSQIHLLWDDRLSHFAQQRLAEAAGPTSAFELTRQYLSTYAWGHYGDLDPDIEGPNSQFLALIEHLFAITGKTGCNLEIGCSVGRGTFELADRTQQLTLGIDINFSMLRVAQRAMRQQNIRYGLRQVGVIYDWRDYSVSLPSASLVDFWAADALALPFAAMSVARIHSMNVIDCVQEPVQHLTEIARVLQDSGLMGVLSPYDWSANATDFQSWLGGRQQKNSLHGQSDAIIRWLCSEKGHIPSLQQLSIVHEKQHVPWSIRVHSRSVMQYQTHLFMAQKNSHPE